MIRGTITARHIITHPFVLITLFGFFGYVRLLARCMDSTPSCFTDFILK
ncbi:MAG TPA: hypothetical protein PLZ86_03515 [bacterium]|mgnify:FL=1|nr:hypothetical protein [bacterium]